MAIVAENPPVVGDFFTHPSPNAQGSRQMTGPVQAVAPISRPPKSWFAHPLPLAKAKTPEEELEDYKADPLFRDVFGYRPGPNDIQVVEIFDKVALVDFFPSFKNGAFKDLSLQNCALTYYPELKGQKEPGLYFQTDLVLGGVLDGAFDFIKMFLDQSYIVIRLSAFLGFELKPTEPLHFDKIVMSGCLAGVKICYPPKFVLLEIISAGVRVTFINEDEKPQKRKAEEGDASDRPTKQRTTTGGKAVPVPLTAASQSAQVPLSGTTSPKLEKRRGRKHIEPEHVKRGMSVELFGSLLLFVGEGSIVPLQLEYTANYTEEKVHFDMVLSRHKTWKDSFGIENLELADIFITAEVPTKSVNKAHMDKAAQAALDDGWGCHIEATWSFSKFHFALEGEIFAATQTQKSSYVEAILEGLTFEDIIVAANKLCGYDVQPPKHAIELESLRLRISKGEFAFYGRIKYDGSTFDAKILISGHGIYISGTAIEWKIPGSEFVLKNASLDLSITWQSKVIPGTGEQPGDTSETNAEGPETPSEGTDSTLKEDVKKSADSTKAAPTGAGNSSADEAKRNESLAAVPAKDAATNTTGTEIPATAGEPPKNEFSWGTLCKVSGTIVLPYGPKESSAPDADYKFKFVVTVTLGWHNKRGFEILVAGKARTSVSLRDIIGEAIEPGSLLDAQLSDLTFLGTNMDNCYVPREISTFPAKKGFFLCATLDRVPLVEDKKGGGKLLHKSTVTDRAYLRIGYQKGDKIPKVTIFLPPSFKIHFGERFYTGAIYLELDASKNPICQFYGELYMRMEEDAKHPVKFTLGIGADHVRGSLQLSMDAKDGLKGPLGLSDRIVIYNLKGSVEAEWEMLLSSGTLSSFGIGGQFAIDTDRYTCEMRLGINPEQTLVNIKARELGFRQIANFVSALAKEDFPIPDINIIQVHDVDIYASRGCTWIDTFYPKGFRIKGRIKFWDFEASMDAEVSAIGLHMLTKIKGFQIGPLRVSGAHENEPDAELELTLNPIIQSLRVTGRIDIFNVSCICYIHCQFMPDPIFEMDFELVWSAGLRIKVHAQMHHIALESDKAALSRRNSIQQHPSAADWELYACMEQSIIAQVKQGIMSAIDNTHKALEAGIGAAQDAVRREQEAYDRRCREAEAALQAKYKEQQDEIDKIDEEIAMAKDNLEDVKRSNQVRIEGENQKRSSTRAQSEKDRAARLEPMSAARRRAEEERDQLERDKPHQIQQAQRRRDDSRGSFFGRFGDAHGALQAAIRDVENAQREVDRLDWEANSLEHRISDSWWRVDLEVEYVAIRNAQAFATAGLFVYKGVLCGARDIVDSQLFRELKEAMESAEQYLSTIGDQIQSALETAGRIVSRTFNELEQAIRDEDFSFNSIMQRANNIVANAEEECQRFAREAEARSKVLDKQKEKMLLEFGQVGTVAMREAVEFARKNNIALIAAQKVLEAISVLEKAAYEAIRGFVGAVMDAMIDIQKVEFKGMITAKKSKQQAFELTVKGRLGESDFEFTEKWMPGKTSVFLAKIGLRAVASITGTDMDKEIQALDEESMKLD
ncbi:hypothetical protein PENCOP_c002G06273 [Penicillium coprophilum]|uniref:Uncharacterized protein n=1 Tax=Penicillium coprophilum TaxID=36646 RepID=A0A1V6V2D9_9EURO|nr:hypothetical protein PENCOP_c002G06273 [Penicillium coprophilum]